MGMNLLSSSLKNRMTRLTDERDPFGPVGLSTSFLGGGYAVEVNAFGATLPTEAIAMPLSIKPVKGKKWRYMIAAGHFESAQVVGSGSEVTLRPGTRIWVECRFLIQFSNYPWSKQDPEDPENEIPINIYYPNGSLSGFAARLTDAFSPQPSGPGASQVSDDDPEFGRKVGPPTIQYFPLGEIRPDGTVSGGGGGPGIRVNSVLALAWA